MITLKNYTHQIQNNLREEDQQKAILTLPFLNPFPTPENVSGFARKNAYFFFADRKNRGVKTIRKLLLKQAVLSQLRVLIQDSGYTSYEDMKLLISIDNPKGPSIELSLILNHRKELEEAFAPLGKADITWLKGSALDFARHPEVLKFTKGSEKCDAILLSITYKDLLSKPDFAQQLAQKANCAVVVFVETDEDEIHNPYPLRSLQRIGNLEDFATEFNYLSDTSCTEETKQGSYIEMELIENISYAKAYSYFPVRKEYHAHDGILQWHVREVE